MQQAQTTVTLDTNTIGAHHASTLDADVAGKRIVLPDALFAEKFNSTQWRNFSVQDLARLAPYVENVWAGDLLARLLRAERDNGVPEAFRLDPFNRTKELRRLITLSAEDPVEATLYFEPKVEPVQTDMAKRSQQVYGTRHNLDHAAEELRDTFSESEIEAAQKDFRLIPDMLRKIGFFAATRDFVQAIPRQSSTRHDPDVLARSDCAFARYNLALYVRQILEVGSKPYTDQRQRKVLSAQQDLQVIVIGSYTDEFLTRDEFAKAISTALRHALRVMYEGGQLRSEWQC